jgi:uncharacterized repeat protein (TIGR03803 family)
MSNSPECRVSMALAVVLGLAALAQAQTFTVLYNFTGGSDGGEPFAGVIQDSSGNLYGTTFEGGYNCATGGCGAVYKLDTAGTETVLYAFTGGKDGDTPVTPLLRDGKGNLYGTTQGGGPDGWGTVFKIDTAGKETILHTFTGGQDGGYPDQGLSMGKSGVVFGTTFYGGSHNNSIGTIFKADGTRNFTTLYSFTHYPYGGHPDLGRLTRDKSGNIYGVTSGGGFKYNYGALYELAANGKPKLLHGFKGGTKDGWDPMGSAAQDKAGNLYGTTYVGGSENYGVIWKVSKAGTETILHNFAGGTSDGCKPDAGVTMDPQGNLYGVTTECGAYGYGTLYELSANGTFTVLHNFDGSDGANPYGEVLWTASGTLFGTTSSGGTYDYYGTVWSYVP